MSAGLVVAVGMALAFAFTNGVHDAANAIATLVATRAARPGTAVLLAAIGNVLGPLLLGSAVASTIAGIVTVPSDQVIPVLGAALTGAVAWNGLTWWRGLPSSSGHALLGGLVGAALAEGGAGSVDWGGFVHPAAGSTCAVALGHQRPGSVLHVHHSGTSCLSRSKQRARCGHPGHRTG
jgi:PiT family inorganic phosphate transporter